MTWLNTESIVNTLDENVYLYNLALLKSSSAVLSRIPDDLGGVYVWYRNFNISKSTYENGKIFYEYILREMQKPHCISREVRIPPSYQISISSDISFPKQSQLKKKSKDLRFRELVLRVLENSLIFQNPLYIGKTNNFRGRINQHLSASSSLRNRLSESNHDIDQCKLLLIGLYVSQKDSNPQENTDEENEEIDNNDFCIDETDVLLEDILSRLFVPSFTVRYG